MIEPLPLAVSVRLNILVVMADAIRTGGVAPTFRQLGEQCHLATSVVAYHMKVLKAQGLVDQPRRAILRITPEGYLAMVAAQKDASY